MRGLLIFYSLVFLDVYYNAVSNREFNYYDIETKSNTTLNQNLLSGDILLCVSFELRWAKQGPNK